MPAKIMAKKLFINNDVIISRKELSSRQGERFQKLDLNGDGMIDSAKFSDRIIAIFETMESNANGGLDGEEISKMRRQLWKSENRTAGCEN